MIDGGLLLVSYCGVFDSQWVEKYSGYYLFSKLTGYCADLYWCCRPCPLMAGPWVCSGSQFTFFWRVVEPSQGTGHGPAAHGLTSPHSRVLHHPPDSPARPALLILPTPVIPLYLILFQFFNVNVNPDNSSIIILFFYFNSKIAMHCCYRNLNECSYVMIWVYVL